MQNEKEDKEQGKSIMGTIQRIHAEGGTGGFYQVRRPGHSTRD
jgi:hypothetical protein